MRESVPIKSGDLICIDTATNTMWIEKMADIATEPHPILPEIPLQGNSRGRRYCPTLRTFEGKKGRVAHSAALDLAYMIAWVAGFAVGNDTECYRHPADTYVFRVS